MYAVYNYTYSSWSVCKEGTPYQLSNLILPGFGTVWLGLETAGKVLAKSLADQTVSVVKHK